MKTFPAGTAGERDEGVHIPGRTRSALPCNPLAWRALRMRRTGAVCVGRSQRPPVRAT